MSSTSSPSNPPSSHSGSRGKNSNNCLHRKKRGHPSFHLGLRHSYSYNHQHHSRAQQKKYYTYNQDDDDTNNHTGSQQQQQQVNFFDWKLNFQKATSSSRIEQLQHEKEEGLPAKTAVNSQRHYHNDRQPYHLSLPHASGDFDKKRRVSFEDESLPSSSFTYSSPSSSCSDFWNVTSSPTTRYNPRQQQEKSTDEPQQDHHPMRKRKCSLSRSGGLRSLVDAADTNTTTTTGPIVSADNLSTSKIGSGIHSSMSSSHNVENDHQEEQQKKAWHQLPFATVSDDSLSISTSTNSTQSLICNNNKNSSSSSNRHHQPYKKQQLNHVTNTSTYTNTNSPGGWGHFIDLVPLDPNRTSNATTNNNRARQRRRRHSFSCHESDSPSHGGTRRSWFSYSPYAKSASSSSSHHNRRSSSPSQHYHRKRSMSVGSASNSGINMNQYHQSSQQHPLHELIEEEQAVSTTAATVAATPSYGDSSLETEQVDSSTSIITSKLLDVHIEDD